MPRFRLGDGAAVLALAAILVALALARPVDHDESQYVAAAVLTAHGTLPYRDFAYLQTPLQPFLLAPVAVAVGAWTWPALRIVNALLGLVAIVCVHGAARTGGARPAVAWACAALFAACDILLFSIGTARNDALPAACLAGAIWLIVRPEQTQRAAMAIGLLLAAAAAAKISYALPAIAYGGYALIDRRRRPVFVLLGAVPMIAFIGWTFSLSPEGFLFGTLYFPAQAPAEFYADRPWKLSLAAKAVDTLKFLALGAALPAVCVVIGEGWRVRKITPLDLLLLAGLIAALLPFPTWRQYLLPMLPPLFVRLAMIWTAQPPGRAMRIATVVFGCAGLAPSVATMAGDGYSLPRALADGAAIRRVMDTERIAGPIATLSPQMLPATGRLPDPRFATGPFYFRSHDLLDRTAERRLHLMSRGRADFAPGSVILTGGETRATAGDPALDRVMARGRAIPVAGTGFTLFVTPPASPSPARHNSP